jgi:hypothetical protein
MKKHIALTMLLLAATSLANCRSASSIKDGPMMQSVYIDVASSVLTPIQNENFDASIYSHRDFELRIVTIGEHPDVFHSATLSDTMLGTRTYATSSSSYKASYDTIYEADIGYVTTIVLLIKGSSGLDTYISQRQINVDRLLFSRENFSGQFEAVLPNHDETLVSLEVHATIYFDATLGLPTELIDGHVNISLIPGSSEYARVKNIGTTSFVIPNSINGYPIGKIMLYSLDWIETLTIEGAVDDVYIIGSYPLLTTLSISGLSSGEDDSIVTYKDFTITCEAPLLTSINIADSAAFNVYIAYNPGSLDAVYRSYRALFPEDAPYSLPSLTDINIEQSTLNEVQLGADAYQVPFINMKQFIIEDSRINYLFFGHENNSFHLMETISATNSTIDGLTISGRKNALLPPAILQLSEGHYGNMFLTGSTIGYIEADGVSFARMSLRGSTTVESVLREIDLENVDFVGLNNNLKIWGNFPDLASIRLSDVTLSDLSIGEETNEYVRLESIELDHVVANTLSIGAAETIFASLESINIHDSEFATHIRIGYENSNYQNLTSLTLTDVSTGNFIIGRLNDIFNSLQTIQLTRVVLTGGFLIHGASFPTLAAIVFTDVTMNLISVQTIIASYDFYFDEVTIASSIFIGVGCTAVYVTSDPATSSPYYDALTSLGLPVLTGTYS